MGAALTLSEGDLHGLVDGRLDPGRRSDALRVLATSPSERAKVEAWQEQNDLIRATFASVEDEPLPPSMRLVAPPALHCVPSPVTTIHPASESVGERRRSHVMAGCAVLVFVVGALGSSWLLLQKADETPQVVDVDLRPSAEASSATTSADILRDDIARPLGTLRASAAVARPATTTIPDLTAAGFTFTHAEAKPTEPQSLVFYYKNAKAENVAVSVARAQDGAAETAPTDIGNTLRWRHANRNFALTGTVEPKRLRAIASLVRGARRGD